MQLTYYNNTTDKRYINKTLETLSLEGHDNPVTIKMLEDSSIVNPVFKLRDVDLYATANYCYVDTLHRYYYIDDVTLSQGYAYLHCTVDVLMSYRQQLHDISVLVDRNQWDYNLYQVDDRLNLYNFTSQKRVEFPSGFDSDKQEFILCVIGNTSSEEVE
jgi:hypothetical protein